MYVCARLCFYSYLCMLMIAYVYMYITGKKIIYSATLSIKILKGACHNTCRSTMSPAASRLSKIPTSETTHADFCAPNAAIQLPRGCWLPADSGFQPVAQHLTGVPFPLTWPDNTTIIVSTSCGGAVLHTIDILVEFCFQSCCCTVLVVVGGLVC